MEILFGCLLITSCAQAYITIHVQNTLINYGRADIDITCRVNGTSIETVDFIQLKRNNTNIVSVSNRGVSWQDKNLKNRSEAVGSTKDVLSSNLHLTIMACNVSQTVDEGSYQCALIANGDEDPLTRDSNKINLNIIGSFEEKQENCGKYNVIRISFYVFDIEIFILLISFHMVVI